jgi:DNA-binding transcriptional MerR regulator
VFVTAVYGGTIVRKIGNRTYYATGEACKKAGISRSTLFRWVKEGILDDKYLKDRNGWRLFSERDIAKIRAEAFRVNRK